MELEEAEERLRVSQVAINKAHDDAKIVMEEVFMFKSNCVAEVGRRWVKDGELTKQFRQLAASTAAGSKKLADVHAKFKSHKANTDLLDKVLKVSRKGSPFKRCTRGAECPVGHY